MLGVGTAGHQVDVVVGATRLARIDAAGRVVAGRPARRRLAGARGGDEHAAAVMHDRILHRHLQPPSLAGARPVEQRADDAERHQHAGAGVADGRAGLDRSAVALAGDAHRAAGGLRDRVERETLLVWAAVAETLDLGIDDAGSDRADHVIDKHQTRARPAVALAGDAHRAAGGLRDRVERETLLVWAAVAETLDLGIDDAG